MMGDSLYLIDEKQKEYEDRLRKGRELFEKNASPELRRAVEDIIKSGNPEAIEEVMKRMLKVLTKYGLKQNDIEEAYVPFLRVIEFQKEQGQESSESVKKISELIKKRLSEIKTGN